MNRNATDPILNFNDTVISVADNTIPKTSTNPKHQGKPWFNDDCKNDIISQKVEWQFGKHPTSDNLGNFRICRAKARRTLKTKWRTSWCSFVSTLNCHTSMNKVWNPIQKSKANVDHLKDGQETLTSEEDISNK